MTSLREAYTGFSKPYESTAKCTPSVTITGRPSENDSDYIDYLYFKYLQNRFKQEGMEEKKKREECGNKVSAKEGFSLSIGDITSSFLPFIDKDSARTFLLGLLILCTIDYILNAFQR
jgi:hypothetical protein